MLPNFGEPGLGRTPGLGLPQVYGYTERSGRSCRIESEVDRDTTVILTLPAGIAAPNGQAPVSADRGSGQRVGSIRLV